MTLPESIRCSAGFHKYICHPRNATKYPRLRDSNIPSMWMVDRLWEPLRKSRINSAGCNEIVNY